MPSISLMKFYTTWSSAVISHNLSSLLIIWLGFVLEGYLDPTFGQYSTHHRLIEMFPGFNMVTHTGCIPKCDTIHKTNIIHHHMHTFQVLDVFPLHSYIWQRVFYKPGVRSTERVHCPIPVDGLGHCKYLCSKLPLQYFTFSYLHLCSINPSPNHSSSHYSLGKLFPSPCFCGVFFFLVVYLLFLHSSCSTQSGKNGERAWGVCQYDQALCLWVIQRQIQVLEQQEGWAA